MGLFQSWLQLRFVMRLLRTLLRGRAVSDMTHPVKSPCGHVNNSNGATILLLDLDLSQMQQSHSADVCRGLKQLTFRLNLHAFHIWKTT